jgi:hypothetical protein
VDAPEKAIADPFCGAAVGISIAAWLLAPPACPLMMLLGLLPALSCPDDVPKTQPVLGFVPLAPPALCRRPSPPQSCPAAPARIIIAGGAGRSSPPGSGGSGGSTSCGKPARAVCAGASPTAAGWKGAACTFI